MWTSTTTSGSGGRTSVRRLRTALHSASPGRVVSKRLRPTSQDYFVLKPKHSGFYDTTLDTLLADSQNQTGHCHRYRRQYLLLFTANDAYMRGMRIIAPSDCVVSNTPEDNAHALRQIEIVLKRRTEPSSQLRFACTLTRLTGRSHDTAFWDRRDTSTVRDVDERSGSTMSGEANTERVQRTRVAEWLKDRSLTLVMLGLFAIFLVGQILTGWHEFNEAQAEHNARAIALSAYLTVGHPWEALFENWESEFLQMAALCDVLTTFLYQTGSPESQPLRRRGRVGGCRPTVVCGPRMTHHGR